ncbi:MAG: hypothetical protein HQL52_07145 [Magnetococcales bacterium]|nr:hypothetical protein [Magnetococcales bacterium]
MDSWNNKHPTQTNFFYYPQKQAILQVTHSTVRGGAIMNLSDLFLLKNNGQAKLANRPAMTKVLKKIFKKQHGKPKSWTPEVRDAYKDAKTQLVNPNPYVIRAMRSILKKKD